MTKTIDRIEGVRKCMTEQRGHTVTLFKNDLTPIINACERLLQENERLVTELNRVEDFVSYYTKK